MSDLTMRTAYGLARYRIWFSRSSRSVWNEEEGEVHYDVYKDEKGQYRFRIVAANNEILAQSEGYHNRDDVLHAVDLIKGMGPGAQVIDETKLETT